MFPLEMRVPPKNTPVEWLGCRDYASLNLYSNTK